MNLWDAILNHLESRVDPHDFESWFRPVSFVSDDGVHLVLRVPNQTFATWIEENFRLSLTEALEQANAGPRSFTFVSRDESVQHHLPFSPSSSPPSSSPEPSERALPTPGDPLTARYTFETFVVGSSNQFAHAAARAVADNPARSYNPLFIYGDTGLGKTHLLHSIGAATLARNPGSRVVCISGERFTNQVINGIRFQRMPEFRDRYRSVDMLLVDDVHFIAGKEKTQEEFVHTFNSLHDAGKQIVITSDRPPKEIKTLEERLRSRFEWGLLADIQPPDLETKVAILRKKADAEGVDLSDSVAIFIASKVRSSIRELEGLFNKVSLWASFTGNPLDEDLAREALRDQIVADNRAVIPADIIKAVSHHYGLKVSEIKSRSNMKSISFPRQIAMYLLKNLTSLSFPEIGKLFGDKHHSTVIYSVEKIEKLKKEDADLLRTLDILAARFR